MEELADSGVERSRSVTGIDEDRSAETGLWENSRLKALVAIPTLEARLLARVSSLSKTIELFGVRTIFGDGTADNLSLTRDRLVDRLHN